VSAGAAETTLARHQASACMLSSPSSTATTMRRPAAAAGVGGEAISRANLVISFRRNGDEKTRWRGLCYILVVNKN
jgi:hypothetical protein